MAYLYPLEFIRDTWRPQASWTHRRGGKVVEIEHGARNFAYLPDIEQALKAVKNRILANDREWATFYGRRLAAFAHIYLKGQM